MEGGYLFLTPEWVHEVARVVQSARSADREFGKLTRGFSLSLVYVITDLPQALADLHGGNQAAIQVQLDKGMVKKLWVGAEIPEDKADFTVTSQYALAKRIFQGEINAATAFIDREIKVEPMSRVYRNPRFTARSIVAGNMLLKVARRVPTAYPDEAAAINDGAVVAAASQRQ